MKDRHDLIGLVHEQIIAERCMKKFLYFIFLISLLIFAGCQKKTQINQPTIVNHKSADFPPANSITSFSSLSLGSLNQNQKAALGRILSDEMCPCDIPQSFAKCVQDAQSCPSAVLLGQWVADKLVQNTPEGVLAYILAREVIGGFSAKPQNVKTDAYAQRGTKNPELTVIEFADFECPQCKNTSKEVSKFLRKYQNKIKVIFRHYPLDAHKMAMSAAIATEAAANQNKFWEMHDALFDTQSLLNDNLLLDLARAIGLNEAQYKKDIKDPKIAARVLTSKKEAEALKLDGTPYFYFNKRPYNLTFNLEGFELRMRMEAARKK